MSNVLWSESFVPFGKGQRTAPGGLCNTAVAEILRTYHRNVAKRYRVVSSETMEKQLPNDKLWISTKLDGELWFLVKREGDVALCTYNGRVIRGIAVTDEAQKHLASVKDVVIAGELVAPPNQGRPRCHHVGAALGAEDGDTRLRFYAFDLVDLDGKNQLSTPYETRLTQLRSWLGEGDGTSRVAVITTVQGTPSEALAYYREWVGTQRFEGIVIRGEQGFTYKIKPTFTIDAVVLAYGSRLVTGTPQLRELTVAVFREDGRLQIIGTVGTGFTEDDRVAWHSRLSGMEVKSSFRMANRDGTLCRFVRPEIVIEIQCNDLVESDANGVPIRRMTLNHDSEKGYSATGDAAVAAMLGPVFLRERTDKVPDALSVGLQQITSRLPMDSSDEEPLSVSDATVLSRRVFVKGDTAVRKVVVLETRKDPRHYAPFVVYATDYSGGRAEPLDTSLRPCATRESADAYVTEWLAENVKRGWVEAGGAAAAAPAETAEPKPKKARSTRAAAGAEEGAAKPDTDAKTGEADTPAPKTRVRKKKDA